MPKPIVFTPWQSANRKRVNMSNAHRTHVKRGDTLTFKATNTKAVIHFPQKFDAILEQGSGDYIVEQGQPKEFVVKSDAPKGEHRYWAETENNGVKKRAIAGTDPSMIID